MPVAPRRAAASLHAHALILCCSQLADSSRTMGSLSMEELTTLCGGGPEVLRAQTRLVQLLDLGYRLGILSLGEAAADSFCLR